MQKRCLLAVLLLMLSAVAIAQKPLRKGSSKKTTSIQQAEARSFGSAL